MTIDLTVFFTTFGILSAIAISLASLIFSIRAQRKVRFPQKRLAQVELDQVDQADTVQNCLKLVKKLNARIAARESRDPKLIEQQPDSFAQAPGESGADWKRRMRLKIQSGAKP